MAQVISLDSYRAKRNPLVSAMQRLETAVRRLEPLVRGRDVRLTPSVEQELVVIAKEVSFGYPDRAAERTERLADLLEHPAFRHRGA
jgi:hypothetical protein